jgi:hypothetical protein
LAGTPSGDQLLSSAHNRVPLPPSHDVAAWVDAFGVGHSVIPATAADKIPARRSVL